MPEHSLFNWAMYGIWSGGFLVTSIWIRFALIDALVDYRLVKSRGLNGALLIEAVRAVRTEVVRLAVASIFTAMGIWALTTDDPPLFTARGRITLLGFLLLGALVCSQTWFDRADRNRQMKYRQ